MANTEPKSALLRLHRVLMTMAITLGVIFTAYSGRSYADSGETKSLVIAVVTALFTIALALYLRWFSRKNAPQL